MRKLLIVVLVALLSGALAQGRLFVEGALSLASGLGLGLQARLGTELGPLALRGGVGFKAGGSTLANLEADASLLYFLRPTGLYFGGGLTVGTAPLGGTWFSTNGSVGMEIEEEFFVELRPALLFSGGASQFVFGVELGFRLYSP